MNDPIQEAENGISALRVLETIARQICEGKIRVKVHAGRVTSVIAEMVIDPATIAGAGIVADLATQLGYGGMEFPVVDSRITEYQALPKRRIA